MAYLSTQELDGFRETLLKRQQVLTEEIRDGNQRQSGDESVAVQEGEVPDSGDVSVALEVNDLRNAEIARDVAELHAIDIALARMKSGDYGICSTCDIEIPVARLEAAPTAERCIRCQTLYEAQHATPTGSTI